MTTAQDEFNALVAEKRGATRHRDDSPPSDSDTDADDLSTTLAASTAYDSKSQRSSIRGARARPSSSRDDPGDDDDGDDLDDGVNAYPSRPRKSSTYYLPRTYDANANTGPKGVIADAGALEELKRGRGAAHYGRTRELALPKAQKLGFAPAAAPRSRRVWERVAGVDDDEDDDDGDDDGDVDEEDVEGAAYVRRWRERRMRELAHEQRAPAPALKVVDAEGFLDAVDGAPRDVVVVVYIFDDEMALSRTYEPHMAALARKHSSARFVALHFQEAEMERAGVPAVVAYRAGDKFAGLVPLAHEVPPAGDVAQDLEAAFGRLGII